MFSYLREVNNTKRAKFQIVEKNGMLYERLCYCLLKISLCHDESLFCNAYETVLLSPQLIFQDYDMLRVM